MALGCCLVLVNRLAAFALPFGSKVIIDDILGRSRADLLIPLGLAVTSAIVVEAATGYAVSQVVGVAAQRGVARLRRTLQGHTLRLPVSAFDTTRSGTLTSRIIADAEQAQPLIGPGITQLLSGTLTAGLALGVLWWLDAPLTAIVVLLLGVFVLALGRGFGWLYPAFRGVSEQSAELTGRLAEALGGIRVVKAYAAERREALRFTRESHRLLRVSVRALRGVSVYTAASTLATGGMGLLVLLVGARAVLAGTMTVGDLVLYLSLVGVLWTPLVQLAATGSQLGKALAALGRIAELRALAAEDVGDRTRQPLTNLNGAVEFRRVSFDYGPGAPALRDVSFAAPAGWTVALVGPSGAGKTTLCHLVASLLVPSRGQILIDGRDLATIRRRDYRARIGVVSQGDGLLFSGTIDDNIRYGRPTATWSDVRRAARLAHCEEFVARLPDGYRTPVGERGVRLSGGERQRVAIARALLADPRILILDEATNQLDPESEALIQAALRTLCRERTTFVIAHRLSTVRNADLILVVEAGRVVERGRHEELVGREGRYAGLYWAQVWDGGLRPGPLRQQNMSLDGMRWSGQVGRQGT